MDQPEVFTRERLVNQRLEDEAWLNEQLRKEVAPSFQGIRDTRELQRLALDLAASVTPASAPEAQLRQDNLLSSLSNSGKLASLQDELARLRLEQELRRLEAQIERERENPPAPTPASSSSAGAGGVTKADLDAAVKAASDAAKQSTAAEIKKAIDEAKLGASAPLASGGSAALSAAQLTSLERFRDNLSYRDSVRAALRERQLDDTHDLDGFTLYTLKFDVAVIGNESSEDVGLLLVSFTVEEGFTAEQYRLWQDRIEQRAQAEALDLQRRSKRVGVGVAGDRLRDRDRDQISIELALASTGQKASTDTTLERDEQAALQTLVQPPSKQTAPQTAAQDKDANIAIAKLVAQRYEMALGFAGVSFRIQELSNNFAVPVLVRNSGPTDAQVAAVQSRLKSMTRTPYVYSVDPKELAQNISDVSSRERVLDLGLQAGLAMPTLPLANLSAAADYLRRSQEFLQAILRKPLVIGVADGANTFGWLFGPRFMIKNGKTGFGQGRTPYSVQATVAVPAWAIGMKLNVGQKWVTTDGRVVAETASVAREVVRLPGDLDALTDQFFASHGYTRREPLLELPSVMPRARVSEGATLNLVLPGQNLWRNPEVFLGGQRADRVRVMPDMRGIIATFDRVLPVVRSDDEASVFLDVEVLTSGGRDSLLEAVEVLPDLSAPSPVKPFLAIAQTHANVGGQLQLAVEPGLVPKGYNDLRFVFSTTSGDGVRVQGTVSVDPTLLDELRKSRSLILPKLTFGQNDTQAQSLAGKEPRIWEARAEIQLVPNGPFLAVPSPREQLIVLFSSDAARAITIDTRSQRVNLDSSESLIRLKLPCSVAVLEVAFPEHVAAMRDNRASVTITHNGQSYTQILVVENDLVLKSGIDQIAGAKVALIPEPEKVPDDRIVEQEHKLDFTLAGVSRAVTLTDGAAIKFFRTLKK